MLFNRVLLEQWIKNIPLAKFLSDKAYFWNIVYARGCSVWQGFPHTPVSSLVVPPRAGNKNRFCNTMALVDFD